MTSFSEITGVLDRTQFPDGMTTDGTRPLTGNLSVSSGVTIDGVDISAFQSQYSGHLGNPLAHSYVRNIVDTAGAAVPRNALTNDSRIYGADGIDVTATEDGLRISGSGGGGGSGGLTGLKSTNLTGVLPDSNGWIQLHGSNGIAVAPATNRLNLTVVPAEIAHNSLGSIGKSDHHTAFIGLTVGANNVAPSGSDRITLATANNRLGLSTSTNTVTFTVNEGNIVHNNLSGLSTGDGHPQYVHTTIARNIEAQHTFGNLPGTAPFLIGSASVNVLVPYLNADKVDGYDLDQGVGTGDTPQFASINLGHASDTTIARVSAGRISVEGDIVALLTATQTLSNKTLTTPTISGTGFTNAQHAHAGASSGGQIPHGNLSGIGANDHHNQQHALVGSDHTASGLTTGHVVRASGATTFAWAQLQHGDLGGVTANQHHNQVHSITGSDHTITASALQVVGATATNTLGLLTPSSNPGAAAAILASSAAGALTLVDLTLSSATASRLLAGDGSKKLVSTTLVSWMAGTTNRVTVTDNGSGGVTLSGPQDIHTAATPTFGGLIASWVRPASDSTTGVQIRNAAGTAIVNVDTTNQRVGIGTTSPLAGYKLHVNGDSLLDGHVETDSIDVNGSLNVYAGDLRVFNSLDFTTPLLYVDESARSIGVNRDPDIQFSVDVAGALRAEWLVGPHAIQLSDATAIMHFDGPGPYNTNFTGTSQTHKGKVGTATGGVIYRPGKFRKAVQMAEATTNLVANPSFEAWAGANPDGWNTINSPTIAQSSESLYGSLGARVTNNSTALDRGLHRDVSGLTIGQTYTLSAWVYNIVGQSRIRAYEGGAFTTGLAASSYTSGTGWQRLVISFVATTTSARVLVVATSAGADCIYDAIQLEQKAYATPYCDGSLGTGHSWSGTAHASTSSRTAARIDYPTPIPGDTGTVMGWVRFDRVRPSNPGSIEYEVFAECNYGAGGMFVGLQHNTSGTRHPVVYGLSTAFGLGSAWTPPPGQWVFIAVTWDGTTVTLYGGREDGNFTSATQAQSASRTFGTDNFTVGQWSGSGNLLNGLLDDLVILSRAADADEIRAIYESNAPVFAESSTSFFKSYGPTPVEINEEGLWVEGPTVGAIFGIYGASSTKSWGGVTLSEGDVLLGRSPSYVLWDDSEVKLKIGNVSNEHLSFDGSTIAFMNGANTLATLDGAEWIIGATATENVRISSTEVQFRNGSTVYTELLNDRLRIGQYANGKSRIEIDDTNGVRLIYRTGDADTVRVSLTHAGSASFTGSVTANSGSIAGVLSVGVSGEIRQGSGTIGSNFTGLRIWNDSGIGRIAGYNSSSTSPQWYAGTDGKFYAGNGKHVFDIDGYTIDASGGQATSSWINWKDGVTYPLMIGSYKSLGVHFPTIQTDQSELSIFAGTLVNISPAISTGALSAGAITGSSITTTGLAKASAFHSLSGTSASIANNGTFNVIDLNGVTGAYMLHIHATNSTSNMWLGWVASTATTRSVGGLHTLNSNMTVEINSTSVRVTNTSGAARTYKWVLTKLYDS
ncbi:putative carbohydrate-binding protein [Virus Rctr71]|nr:putative carbohydrate-binding protein [Virus Rctr71]